MKQSESKINYSLSNTMDHNMHHNNAALHWSYGAAAVPTAPQSHWVTPPQAQSLKRAMSESDCEELYSEESSKEQ